MPEAWPLLPLFARSGGDVDTVLLVRVTWEPSERVLVMTWVMVWTLEDEEL
jgi:hypothetical protein